MYPSFYSATRENKQAFSYTAADEHDRAPDCALFLILATRMILIPIMFIVVAVCAFFFYCAGRFEGASGLLWAGLSLGTSIVIWRWLHGGLTFILLGQLGVYIGITVFRARKKP